MRTTAMLTSIGKCGSAVEPQRRCVPEYSRMSPETLKGHGWQNGPSGRWWIPSAPGISPETGCAGSTQTSPSRTVTATRGSCEREHRKIAVGHHVCAVVDLGDSVAFDVGN